MREIKFRVWDKEEKKMYPLKTVVDFMYTDEAKEEGGGSSPYVLMQYTGLTDESGREIYEGDIIEIKWGNAVERNIVKYDVGKFSSGFLFFKGASDDTSGYNMLWGIEDSEIIGNIYENPELLNKLINQEDDE